MTAKQLPVVISIILLLTSCSKKLSNLEFEKSVAYEIFPALLDSVHYDRRIPPNFPPPPPPPVNIKNKDSTNLEWDETKLIAEYEKRRVELEKDTTKLVIAIVDSTYRIDEQTKKKFINFYKEYSIKLDTINNDTPYKINISDLKHNEKIILKYRSELPTSSKVWDEKYDFYLSGITGFSRIQFDQTKSYGILISGFGCGRLCGWSGIFFIRKIDGKWQIVKIEVTGIS
ncbi:MULTISPECIES: hypothetical protein [Cellulophaga]|uniref:Lipoprotein n=1 Tax=Cellulophaga baltica TaxID=76594 RepID=A0A1G7HDH4_9FLAO|nr:MULTISPECIES: hypothetical protein [Cellulophaga]QXP52855.1 hypothetical protein H0I24_02715 [Cellulophaga sp. HaHa_2_1]SDE98475.1 hypothetical protein SAMN04487992_1063 [Cellulophaga baltica]